mgnify:CR=1 FL=1
MSRVGKMPVVVPAGVDVTIAPEQISVKGTGGHLHIANNALVNIQKDAANITFLPANESREANAMSGTMRQLVNNMVVGVSNGWTKELELIGVGYRASNQGQILDLSLGYSHTIMVQLPSEVSLETKSEKGKNPLIILKSFDKQLLGMIAAKIRSFRKPEPYKGKGVRYVNEVVRRKAGKSAGKGKK